MKSPFLSVAMLFGALFASYGLAEAVVFTSNVTAPGNISVVGAVSKGAGTFVIDHPLDPANKLLYHSFVESPDVKNIYDGIATLNEKGEATIELPGYFLALNRSFRYQFFPLSGTAPGLYLKEGADDDAHFTVSGGTPGGRISWQITGIRHDRFIQAYPVHVEVEKGEGQPVKKGEYIFEGYDKK
jgi:hypothetical protein